jgi:hypothetical protein
MDQLESQLTAADVELADDVLDRIDQIVPPGVTINPADGGWVSPALQPAARRRWGVDHDRDAWLRVRGPRSDSRRTMGASRLLMGVLSAIR